ncbi:MAG: HDOD domain-containing protein [Pseudomonadota bacterium]
MLNRPNALTNESLDARRTVGAQLRERLQELPPTPFDWASFDPSQALGNGAFSPDLRLATMTRLLCTAPARSAELRALWNESVLTGAYALRIAPHLGGDAHISGIAGLLHRLGDILTLRAIAVIEHASRLRLDAASKADLCAEHGGGQLERVVRAWGVPPRAAATAAEWRRLREFPGAAADATAVYLARLFAIEATAPQFCAPGAIEHAADELGLGSNILATLRGDATIAALVNSVQ